MKPKSLLLLFTLLFFFKSSPKPDLHIKTKGLKNLRIKTKDLEFKLIEVTLENIDLFLCRTAQIKSITVISIKNRYFITKKISQEQIEKMLKLLSGKLREIHFYDFDLEESSLESIKKAGIIVKVLSQNFYKQPKFESNSDVYDLDEKGEIKNDINEYPELEIEKPDSPHSPNFGGSTPTNPWIKLK